MICICVYLDIACFGLINEENVINHVNFQGCHGSGKSQGNVNFFKVRKFCKLSGKCEIFDKCQGIVREF